jgi:hypothetical protein
MNFAGKSNYWLLSILSIALVSLSIFGRMGGGELSDDSEIIRQGRNESSQFRTVQGASSTTTVNDDCPQDRPIIGWINLEGKRKIKYQLDNNEFASACFIDVDEAKKAGYSL